MQLVVIILHFLIFSNPAMGQVLDEENLLNKEEKDATLRRRLEPRISEKYYRGRYLIYDCRSRHFVCVNLPSFYNCKESRLKDIENKVALLSCAPLKQYNSQKDCFEANYSLIHKVTNKSFCVNIIY